MPRQKETAGGPGRPFFFVRPCALGAGSIEGGRVPWLRLTVICGGGAAPWLVTPRIGREEIEKVDGDYRYVVE